MIPSKTKSAESEDQRFAATEIFVTKVNVHNTNAYRAWVQKIHDIESTFPGFQRIHIQPPTPGRGDNWITLLQFNSQENLDRWLTSDERQKILKEAEDLVASLESHRVISPFASWFTQTSSKENAPPIWKQTCLILLVLFPIVMLELKFLSPHLQHLNPSLSMFISNAISVTLISWPMMPIAIYFLNWWLAPNPNRALRSTIEGIFLLLALYFLEIISLWELLV